MGFTGVSMDQATVDRRNAYQAGIQTKTVVGPSVPSTNSFFK